MTVSAGRQPALDGQVSEAQDRILQSILKLSRWLEQNDYCAYDTFDGLNARFVRPFTFNNNFLRTVLQQGIRRFPLNLRPLLGVKRDRSTKGMGFIARGLIRFKNASGDARWGDMARYCLDWLIENQTPGYSGACWGNHFDYQSRSFYLPARVPTVVWTSLIGHSFLDGYREFGDPKYLETADSACVHILKDLEHSREGRGLCISYVPFCMSKVHNANTLGASLLARVSSLTGNQKYRDLAVKALTYTAECQRPDFSWWYGEKQNLHWVDNFHTAYVLDCFKYFADATGDKQFEPIMLNGYQHWKNTFFLSDGTPRYYDYKTLPIDIQCSSQAIDTLVFFGDRDEESISLARKVALWTIQNMQDDSGYFYYRRYSRWIVNKTPTLHWGQATMLCALAGLYQALQREQQR